MRTETDLRTALGAITDQHHDTDAIFRSIVAVTRRRRGRRVRVLVLSAALAVLVVAAAIAVPDRLVTRTVVPADQRVEGNWNLTHTVDPLPDGWQIRHAIIGRDGESLNVGPIVGSSTDQSDGCDVRVSVPGVGAPPPDAPQTPIEVAGRPGVYVDGTDPDHVPGAYWRYTDEAWAYVGCATRASSVTIAARLRPAVTATLLPFRFAALPEGYRVAYVVPPRTGAAESLLGAVQLVADGSAERPAVAVLLQSGPTTAPAGIAGWETATVRGIPAVLSARDGRLCLNASDHSLCFEAGEGTPADLNVSLWPAGRRELLLQLAEQATLAPDLDDPTSWFDANETLPR